MKVVLDPICQGVSGAQDGFGEREQYGATQVGPKQVSVLAVSLLGFAWGGTGE